MININSSTPIIGIYKITSPSGKIYIGQSVNITLRWNQYKLLYKTIMGPKLYHSLKKYGCDNHTFEVIEECNADQLDEREIYWGQHYDVLTEAGLNLKLGESNGYYSDETKQKMSEAMMGRKITWKAGRRKGYVMTEEQKIIAELFEICNSSLDIAREFMGEENSNLNRLQLQADALLKNPAAIRAVVASVWSEPDTN